MSKHKRELTWALAGVIVVSAVYFVAYVVAGEYPRASGALGHTTGVIGILLMLGAQTAYSMRKQTKDARWGPMVKWLQAHVMMGLLGPYMVLIHSAGKLNGVAAIAAVLTLVTVLSGIVGRYIYTSIPKEIEGVDPERLAKAKKALATWRAIHIPITWAMFTSALLHSGGALYYATLLR
jgi:hypothetical protein